MSEGPRVLMPADIRFPLERANGVQIVKTAAALAAEGLPTTLLVRRSDPRPTRDVLHFYGLEPPPALEVARLRVGHRRGAFRLPRAAFLARALWRAARQLRRGGVVFTRDLQLADLLLRFGPARPGALVYEAHAVEALMYAERGALYGTGEARDPRKQRRLAAREARVWRGAHGFVATTAGIRDSFAEAHGPRERVRVVPNGCDPPRGAFPGLSREDPPRVLYAGQLYPWKGVDVLVEAMASVAGARLVILGGLAGEPDFDRVQRLAAARGLEGRVEMPGTVPQARVAQELSRASVVAVPFLRTAMTERHTSPLKAFEAMAAGRPIVATDLPSSREVLRHDETALLVPPGDAAALGAAVGSLLGDPALAERLARGAFAAAPAYSWEARARALAALFAEVA
ncbi:MAG TPA: glycosyltransferase family 4 protein [Vicinamibacteria bacterium]